MKGRRSNQWRSIVALLTCVMACAATSNVVVAVDPVTAGAGVATIINGNNAPTGAYPWMAALISKTTGTSANSQRQFCGGSLIAPTWVLTAGHCVDWQSPEKFQVLVGRENLDAQSGGQLLDVSEIVTNPRFDHNTMINDIALIRLATPATITPASLPAATDVGKLLALPVIPLGWGTTTGYKRPDCTLAFTGTVANKADYGCSTLAFSKQGVTSLLQLGRLDVLTANTCYNKYIGFLDLHGYSRPAGMTADNFMSPGTLCLMDLVSNTAACYGDSGGPVLATLAGKQVVAGVASFVIEQKCSGTYGLQFYTEVAAFLDFITQTMAGSKELALGQLCPLATTPTVSVQAAVAGAAPVVISWKPVTGATGYTLMYTPVPHPDGYVGVQALTAGATEIQVTLPSASHYLITLRVRGTDCDSGMSAPVGVDVP